MWHVVGFTSCVLLTWFAVSGTSNSLSINQVSHKETRDPLQPWYCLLTQGWYICWRNCSLRCHNRVIAGASEVIAVQMLCRPGSYGARDAFIDGLFTGGVQERGERYCGMEERKEAWVWRSLAWRDWGFESRRGHRCRVVKCCVLHVEFSATGRSLVQRSLTECVNECDQVQQ